MRRAILDNCWPSHQLMDRRAEPGCSGGITMDVGRLKAQIGSGGGCVGGTS